MKKITTLVLLSCLMSLRSFADVIWQETFNYTNGSIALTSTNGNPPGLTNWLTHSGSSDNFVNNKRLEVSTSSANGGVTVTRSGDINRQFSITNSSVITNAHQLVYASFIVNFTNLPTTNGAYFAHFKAGLPSSGTFQGRLWALIGGPLQTTNNFTALPKTFRLGVSASGSGSPSKTLGLDLALNTDYQVIMGWDPVTLFAVTMWVNPVSSSDASATSSDAFAPTAANIANSFAFRQASGFGGFLTVSNLVCATTFDEALTNGRPTNAVAPSIVYQPVGVTNFVNSVIALSAVANGQGQAGLTYSWFRSNSVTGFQPFANPAGNTNVLAFASAQTTDTGHYQLAVTTPYGLSVTSTPVSVLISAVPVPPSFVIQPGSQTLFRGQNLTLTTTVSSPGNCTFTWFSNNVVVLTTGPDNTGTSSYTLNNVVTNNSATYKVAVTNDVVVTGIVSTNSVVTVLNPPHVSIAFLRSLVDPNANYSATNSTQPYEVTGVVTTYTNITLQRPEGGTKRGENVDARRGVLQIVGGRVAAGVVGGGRHHAGDFVRLGGVGGRIIRVRIHQRAQEGDGNVRRINHGDNGIRADNAIHNHVVCHRHFVGG